MASCITFDLEAGRAGAGAGDLLCDGERVSLSLGEGRGEGGRKHYFNPMTQSGTVSVGRSQSNSSQTRSKFGPEDLYLMGSALPCAS